MKTITAAAILTFSLAVGTFGSQAQADEVVWHFPYKFAPYATRVKTPKVEHRQTLHRLWCAKGITPLCTKAHAPAAK